MTKFWQKLAAGLTTISLLGSILAPSALAAVNVNITNNGDGSTNDATVDASSSVDIIQSNESDTTNNVTVKAKTGKNTANSNTGSGVTISTGNATADSTVSNTANTNTATVSSPAVPSSTTTIDNNGVGSSNTTSLTLAATVGALQANACTKLNNITKKAKTGKNTANSNTGGTVSITTGAASATGSVTNICNTNTLSL